MYVLLGFANRVVAVELNKSLCKAAEQNLLLNNIHNVHVVAGDSQKFAYKVLKKMSYTIVTLQGVQNESEKVSVKVSEKVSETIEFDMILVDPPRCGLDPSTRKLIGAYKFILYISCNPDALHRDIQSVST